MHAETPISRFADAVPLSAGILSRGFLALAPVD